MLLSFSFSSTTYSCFILLFSTTSPKLSPISPSLPLPSLPLSLPLTLFVLNNDSLAGVKFYLLPLAEVHCLCAVLEVRSSDAAPVILNLPSIFIGPNYYTLLAIITFYYQFKTGQRFKHSGLLPTVSPL